MAIEKQHGKYIFICDECGDDIDTNETIFFQALDRIKEEGWLVTRNADDTEWVHVCGRCTGYVAHSTD